MCRKRQKKVRVCRSESEDTYFISEIDIYVRESPSGKAVAFQATIRGSESRLPLNKRRVLIKRRSSFVFCDKIAAHINMGP